MACEEGLLLAGVLWKNAGEKEGVAIPGRLRSRRSRWTSLVAALDVRQKILVCVRLAKDFWASYSYRSMVEDMFVEEKYVTQELWD